MKEGTEHMHVINPADYRHIVFFTGAGMSAESGIPTYRGKGGTWSAYNWEEYACQEAFDRDPEKVLSFHEMRRRAVLACEPHAGHYTIARVQRGHPHVTVVTQNIDGMHQRAGCTQALELHGSLWRLRCSLHGAVEDLGETYRSVTCSECGQWLRPDIIWFGDMLDPEVTRMSIAAIAECDLFVSIGTSGVVWPAAGYPEIARNNGAYCIEINPEASPLSHLYDEHLRHPAGTALPSLFDTGQ